MEPQDHDARVPMEYTARLDVERERQEGERLGSSARRAVVLAFVVAAVAAGALTLAAGRRWFEAVAVAVLFGLWAGYLAPRVVRARTLNQGPPDIRRP